MEEEQAEGGTLFSEVWGPKNQFLFRGTKGE